MVFRIVQSSLPTLLASPSPLFHPVATSLPIPLQQRTPLPMQSSHSSHRALFHIDVIPHSLMPQSAIPMMTHDRKAEAQREDKSVESGQRGGQGMGEYGRVETKAGGEGTMDGE